MMLDRFATEQMAVERFTAVQQGKGDSVELQQVNGKAGKPLRARVTGVMALSALALAFLCSGLITQGGVVLADSAGGGAAVAEGVGYVP